MPTEVCRVLAVQPALSRQHNQFAAHTLTQQPLRPQTQRRQNNKRHQHADSFIE